MKNRLVYNVPLDPATIVAVGGAPAKCRVGWEVMPPFAALCAREGCWNICGAACSKLGRCAMFLESISC